ncbi:unnamed protein product [Absidia cylindrospora]
MTPFASSLSHPDWRIWILAAPAANAEPIVLDEVTEGGSDDNHDIMASVMNTLRTGTTLALCHLTINSPLSPFRMVIFSSCVTNSHFYITSWLLAFGFFSCPSFVPPLGELRTF